MVFFSGKNCHSQSQKGREESEAQMISPGLYSWAYPSAAVSKYYAWFVLMQYPELDIWEEKNGEWFIISYLNAPIIPSMTQWQPVLGPMKNVEKSFGFCQKYAKELDLNRRAFWDREEKKTKAMLAEHDAADKHKEEYVNEAHNVITKNPDLMERIAKNGVREMDLSYLGRQVHRKETFKHAYRGEKVDVCNTSEPVQQIMDETVPQGLRRKTGDGE